MAWANTRHTNNKNKEYYVYEHVCPKTGEVLYVGHGKRVRAWLHYVPFRSEEHAAFLETLIQDGYTPADFVQIVNQGLFKHEASSIEKQLIQEYNYPKFNKLMGIKHVRMNKQELTRACELRSENTSYANIGKELNIPTMTVFRALNNENIQKKINNEH